MSTPISRDLYKNLPYYLRMLDEQGSGMLKHLIDPTQTQLDKWTDAKGMIELIENPDTIPKNWAYWAQQKVGGAGTRENWIGIGVHPDWPVERMRRFLLEGWNYWNTKGTQSSIRWAIDFWLDWEKAQDPIYLEFRRPFGDRPTSELPQWWSYTTPYGAHTTQHYTEYQFFGGGDYPQQYQPDARTLHQDTWPWDFGTVWDDRLLVLDRPPEINNSRSGLGPRNVWMHFHVDEFEWNKIAPDIHKLNPETYSALARPQVFLWQDIEIDLKLVEDPEFPIAQTRILYNIDGFQFGDIFPWPVEQPPRTEIEIVHRAWQPDPYFQFNDCWGGTGGEVVPHSDRYTQVEVQRFSPFWTAYTFLATIVKIIAVPGTVIEQISIPTTLSVLNELGVASFGVTLEVPGDRTVVVGTDFQSLYGFEPNPEPTAETSVQLVFSQAIEWFTDYQDCFGGGNTLVVTEPQEQILTTLATVGSGYEDVFYSQGVSTISTTTTSVQSYVGADYLSGYDEMWQYSAAVVSTQESSLPFFTPAELWSVPYSQRTVLQEFPATYTPLLPGNQWFAPDRYTEVETVTVTPPNSFGQPSEFWQFTDLRSPADEQVEVTETIECLGFNGAQYTDTYAWEIPASTAQSTSTAIRYLPGATFQDCFNELWTAAIEDTVVTETEVPRQSGAGTPWTIARGAWIETVEELIPGIPEFTDPATTHLWYVNYREWDEEVEIEIPGVQNCWSGLLADIETESQEIQIPEKPGFPPRLWGSILPDTQTVTVTPGSPGGVGMDFQSPYLSFKLPQSIAHNLAPISLDGIAPLAIDFSPQPPTTFNPYVVHDLFAGEDRTFNSEDWWQYPAKQSVETVITDIGGFRLGKPQLCFQYFDAYGQNFEWYAYGETTEASTAIEPVIQQYNLCNVVDNYTLKKIENRREIVDPIPESERAIKKTYPLLQQAAKQQSWTLSVETDEELLLVEPLVIFTEKDGNRSLAIELDRKLNIEFVFIVGRFTHIRSISLFVGHELVESKTYTVPLNVHPKDKIGFKFTLSLVPQMLVAAV